MGRALRRSSVAFVAAVAASCAGSPPAGRAGPPAPAKAGTVGPVAVVAAAPVAAPPAAPSRYAETIAALRSPDPEARLRAMDVLGRDDVRDDAVLAALAAAVADPS